MQGQRVAVLGGSVQERQLEEMARSFSLQVQWVVRADYDAAFDAVVRGEADAVVRVTTDRTGRRVLSVSARNTPQEFEIFYIVEYSIDVAGTEAVP